MARALPVAAAAWFASSGAAAVVYNSFHPSQFPPGILINCDPDETDSAVELPGSVIEREFNAQVGDLITLAGTDRFVTGFAVRVAAFTPHTVGAAADVTLRLYDSVNGLPVNQLWSGTVPGVALPLSNAGVEVNFTPGISVPDSLVFAVSFSNVVNAGKRPLGLGANAAVYTGASPVSVIEQETESQTWKKVSYPTPFQRAEARVTAVPGFGPLGLVGAGVIGLAARRRTSRAG